MDQLTIQAIKKALIHLISALYFYSFIFNSFLKLDIYNYRFFQVDLLNENYYF